MARPGEAWRGKDRGEARIVARRGQAWRGAAWIMDNTLSLSGVSKERRRPKPKSSEGGMLAR